MEGKSKGVKYPESESTDPAVLEKLVGKKPMSQAERESSAPSFEEEAKKLLGMKSPAERKADAEHQLEIMADVLPPGTGLKLISTRQLKESPTNPRKRKGNIDDLIASIRKLGVLQPPLGRWIKDEDGDIEIVVGHQRVRAAKEVGLDVLMIDVRQLSDNEVLEVQASEQIQRTDLHELEEAEHYGRMIKAGYAAETIADRIGKSKAHVLGRLKLLDLCPEARAALFEAEFHGSVAIPLARIYPGDVQAKALKAMAKIATARGQIEFLQKEFSHNLKGAPFNPKDELLVESAGSCIACPHNANNMPPTLFGDYEKGLEKAGLCLNTPCYGVKARAQAQLTLAKAKESGAEVLSAAEARDVLQPTGALQYKAEYVKADDMIQADRAKRTWKQLFVEKLDAADRPKVTVAPDPANVGKTIELYDRKEAMKAAREMGLKWAQPAGGSPSKSPEEKADAKAEKDKARAASAKQEAVLRTTQLTIPALVEKTWSKKAGLPEMRVIALDAFDKRKTFSDDDQEIVLSGFDIPGAKNGKIPTDAAVTKWIEKEANLHELIALTMVLMKYEAWIDTDSDFEPGFADLCANAGADLKASVRAQQLEASLAADKGKGKKS